MRNEKIFWIYGVLQSLVLATIIYLLFHSLNVINGADIIRIDTQVVLSILFPLFLLIVEYIIYSKK